MSGLASNNRKPSIILLAGGKGTRLRMLDSSRPKPMVLVRGKPFLHWLVAHYEQLGYREFLISTGYMAAVIENYEWSEAFPQCRFEFARESSPLGTGGAVKSIFDARADLNSAWVVNGDTLLPQSLPEPGPRLEALYTVLDRNQLFDATPNLHIEGDFVVAEGSNGQYFDGGAVFVARAAIERAVESGFRMTPCSMHELLRAAMQAKMVGWNLVPGTCYDIGTPERYQRFERYLVEKEIGEKDLC